jgi:hypothetical protein
MSAPASDTVVVVSPNPVGSASGDESVNEKTGISVDDAGSSKTVRWCSIARSRTVATRATAVRT